MTKKRQYTIDEQNHWEGETFSYVMDPDHELGFEIATGGSSAPTGPIIRTKPSTNPKPR